MDFQKKARILWSCRRGMLELDLILQQFMKHGFEHLTEKEIQSFELLLDSTDPELFSWLMGHADPKDRELYQIVHLIRNYN